MTNPQKTIPQKSMNFFQRQDEAHRKTGLLVFLFILAVLFIFLAIHTLITAVIQAAGSYPATSAFFYALWLNPQRVLTDFAIIVAIIGGASLFKVMTISALQGDGIAKGMGGRLVDRNTTDPREKRLLNIVDEMAIASGIQVPNVYIMDGEPSINAFAAGFTPDTSIVAVTSGTLDYLTRDELQGVIGHEFSHILNGDTRINLRLMGVLFGLEMLVIIGIVIFRGICHVNFSSSSSRSNKDGGNAVVVLILILFLLAIGLIIIGYIGQFFSNLIRAAISRQREFLADASSVQFTRNPDGIGGALKKIGCQMIGSHIQNTNSIEASNFFFANIYTSNFSSLWDSHPPLDERILRILPNFDGNFPKVLQKVEPITGQMVSGETIPPDNDTEKGLNSLKHILQQNEIDQLGLSSGNMHPVVANTIGAGMFANAIAESIGSLNQEKLVIASDLLKTIPNELVSYISNKDKAGAVVYALLFHEWIGSGVSDFQMAINKFPVLREQWEYLSNHTDQKEQVAVRTSLHLLKALPLAARLPIVQITIPSLKSLDKQTYITFRNNVVELIKIDGKVNLFEYALQHLLIRNLDRQFGLASPVKIRFRRFNDVLEPFQKVLSYLAWHGNDNAEQVEQAFISACEYFYMELEILPREECTAAMFGSALNLLSQSSPVLKQKLITAFYYCVANDGQITVEEGELMRAICAALDVPMPCWEGEAAS